MQAQADAYTAFFDGIYNQPWLAGVFWWDWGTNPHDGGRCDGGAFSFTPAGKPSEHVMQERFGSNATAGRRKQQQRQLQPPSRQAAMRDDKTVVYTDGLLSNGWSDWSYNGKTDLRNTEQHYSNHTYSAYGNFSNWGAMSFKGRALRTADYSAISLRIHSSASSMDQVQLALYGTADSTHPFSPQFLSHYVQACTLPVDGWVDITVPLADLLPPPPAPALHGAALTTAVGTGNGGIEINRLEVCTASAAAAHALLLGWI